MIKLFIKPYFYELIYINTYDLMKQLIALIAVLSKEEHQEFVAYLKRKNRRGDTKNVLLFKLILAGETNALDRKLYGTPSKNAFHALCKRLQDSLLDFISGKSFSKENSEELEILKLLLASRIFFEQKQYYIAFKSLLKAEKRAKRIAVYPILNEVYHTKIQYAHLNPSWSLTAIIQESEANHGLFQQEYQLNLAYATIKAELKTPEGKSLREIIEDTFATFHIELNDTLGYKALYQLMEIVSTAAKLQSNYHTIAPFMERLYGLIGKKGLLADKHRYYHIHILNLMAITHFRNKKFSESLQLTANMETEMMKNNREFYKRFHEKLTVLKALNRTYTGALDDALMLLEAYPQHSLDLQLLHMTCLFQGEHFNKAYALLRSFRHSDDWYTKKVGWQWVIKKNIIELLLLIELDKLDLVLLRAERFKRTFSKKLRQLGEQRVLTFVQLALRYYENPRLIRSEGFEKEVGDSFTWLGRDREDIFVMGFYAWLKAKMQGASLYAVTLDLVRSQSEQ